jgi:hypothetical protein
MQPPSVDSPQNKELLWDTLQESGAFAGLVQSQFQPVQSAFDRTVSSAARFSSSMSLNDANKRIIRDFVQVLQQLRQSGQSKPAHQPAQQPAKPIELVYRAEDLQNERASEFDRNLREKQAEMDAFLTLKKPADVNFSDTSKGVLDDKPIGDEMSRLIAQELAARERELVQLKPEDIKKAQQWLGATATTATMPIPIPTTKPNNAQAQAQAQNVVIKKSVSFSEEEHEMEQMEQMEQENFEEMDIFSKFKKLSTTESETETEAEAIETIEREATEATETINVDSNVVSMQQIYAKLLELEERMNANHAEIMARLNNKGGVIGEP